MIAYFAILITALAAFLGAPIWAVLPCAGILLVSSLRELSRFTSRFEAIQSSNILNMAAWQSGGQALLASGAGYALGALSRAVLQF
ncbi:MAG: hypothetical protein IPL91_02700 [Hyphomicrobium sp.]|nr:hypothetical protein [Hyphomicrobium sp.]